MLLKSIIKNLPINYIVSSSDTEGVSGLTNPIIRQINPTAGDVFFLKAYINLQDVVGFSNYFATISIHILPKMLYE
jgi:hypothetical protein